MINKKFYKSERDFAELYERDSYPWVSLHEALDEREKEQLMTQLKIHQSSEGNSDLNRVDVNTFLLITFGILAETSLEQLSEEAKEGWEEYLNSSDIGSTEYWDLIIFLINNNHPNKIPIFEEESTFRPTTNMIGFYLKCISESCKIFDDMGFSTAEINLLISSLLRENESGVLEFDYTEFIRLQIIRGYLNDLFLSQEKESISNEDFDNFDVQEMAGKESQLWPTIRRLVVLNYFLEPDSDLSMTFREFIDLKEDQEFDAYLLTKSDSQEKIDHIEREIFDWSMNLIDFK